MPDLLVEKLSVDTDSHYSETRIKRPLKKDKAMALMTHGSLMKVESIAECSLWSILQYFWPALSDKLVLKNIFWYFWEWRFRQVLLYKPCWLTLVKKSYWIYRKARYLRTIYNSFGIL